MSNRNDNMNNCDNYKTYSNNLQNLQDKLAPILDDFLKYYVFFNKNPTYNEYQNIYNNLISNLDSINSELFEISKNVSSDTENLNETLVHLNNLIKQEKLKYTSLNSQVSNYKNNYNASTELIKDFKYIYNLNYLKNIFIFTGIVISSILLLKIFKQNPTIIKQ
jgi:DNA repair ATPase RecN